MSFFIAMRFRVLRSYDNYITAHLHLHQLEAENIRAVIEGEHAMAINPLLCSPGGGIKIVVPEVQWQRALSVLQKIETPDAGTN